MTSRDFRRFLAALKRICEPKPPRFARVFSYRRWQ